MGKINEVEILLVEDNPDDAGLAIRELKKNNLANNLMHLSDGQEALDFIFATGRFSGRNIKAKPKVVLLDLKMPKIDGMQVLRAIKSDERTSDIPVVVMTSSKEESDLIESYKLGVNSYVVKPVGFENFSRAVAQLGLYWLLINQIPGK